MGKYKIESLEAWVWRIAHNRYARFLKEKNRRQEYPAGEALWELAENCPQVDGEEIEDEYEPVFRCLHTLSSEYRNIFVDYYMEELSVKELARKYSLSESAVKWRLNVGRSKIRERIGAEKMDKVYQRINWNDTGCNGSMDAGKYLHTQIARAICQAAYEKPLTVEEISLCTGLPTLYIEDELARLEYGDAVRKTGNKYAADFIIFRLEDRAGTEAVLRPMVDEIAGYCEEILAGKEEAVREIGFYGSGFGMRRLGYILVPYLIRRKIRELKNGPLNLADGEFPPRKDGGYGWFIVEETLDESESVGEFETGCNAVGCGGCLYYYWMTKYFDQRLYDRGGMKLWSKRGLPFGRPDGTVPDWLSGEERLGLLERNLMVREGEGFRLNFPCFTREQFDRFCGLCACGDGRLDEGLSRWLLSVRKSFEKFVPRRLHSQINQWITCYAGEIVGSVIEELISRGALERPRTEQETAAVPKPLANGIFYVEGNSISL